MKQVKCALTGKVIEKVPSWLADVEVKFISSSLNDRSATELSTGPTETKDPNKVVGKIDDKED